MQPFRKSLRFQLPFCAASNSAGFGQQSEIASLRLLHKAKNYGRMSSPEAFSKTNVYKCSLQNIIQVFRNFKTWGVNNMQQLYHRVSPTFFLQVHFSVAHPSFLLESYVYVCVELLHCRMTQKVDQVFGSRTNKLKKSLFLAPMNETIRVQKHLKKKMDLHVDCNSQADLRNNSRFTTLLPSMSSFVQHAMIHILKKLGYDHANE